MSKKQKSSSIATETLTVPVTPTIQQETPVIAQPTVQATPPVKHTPINPRSNTILTARGIRVFEVENGQAIFGYRDLQIYSPSLKCYVPLSTDPDKFMLSSDDPESISDTWFLKWKQYILKRFKVPYIKIETIHESVSIDTRSTSAYQS